MILCQFHLTHFTSVTLNEFGLYEINLIKMVNALFSHIFGFFSFSINKISRVELGN